MREIISLHVGQAGLQVGASCWQLFCLEHGITADGIKESVPYYDDQNFSAFFSQDSNERYTPRALFIDHDSESLDTLRFGTQAPMLQESQLVSGSGLTGGSYARSHYVLGPSVADVSFDRIYQLAEQCSDLEGFMIYHSVSGGTGSGLTSLLLSRLQTEFPKSEIVTVNVFPYARRESAVVEPYNTVLSTHSLLEYSDVSFVYDNEGLDRVSREVIDPDDSSLYNWNQILTQALASLTANLRYDSCCLTDLAAFKANLVPYSRIHFTLQDYSPYFSALKPYHDGLSTYEISISAFNSQTNLANCDPSKGKMMACSLVLRGDNVPKDVGQQLICGLRGKVRWVDWTPTGFRCGLLYSPGKVMSGGDLLLPQRSMSAMYNSTAVKQVFRRAMDRFDQLYKKRGFLNWYVSEGMEEGEFAEAKEDVEALLTDYDEVEEEISE